MNADKNSCFIRVHRCSSAAKNRQSFSGSGSFTIANSPVYSTNSGSVAWLETGQIGGNMSAQGTPVTISANPRNLAPGTYTASVSLAIEANGVPVNPPPLQVNFVVTSGEVLSSSVDTVILNRDRKSTRLN